MEITLHSRIPAAFHYGLMRAAMDRKFQRRPDCAMQDIVGEAFSDWLKKPDISTEPQNASFSRLLAALFPGQKTLIFTALFYGHRENFRKTPQSKTR